MRIEEYFVFREFVIRKARKWLDSFENYERWNCFEIEKVLWDFCWIVVISLEICDFWMSEEISWFLEKLVFFLRQFLSNFIFILFFFENFHTSIFMLYSLFLWVFLTILWNLLTWDFWDWIWESVHDLLAYS